MDGLNKGRISNWDLDEMMTSLETIETVSISDPGWWYFAEISWKKRKQNYEVFIKI